MKVKTERTKKKENLRERLKKKMQRPGSGVPPDPPPRYDKVFVEGSARLNDAPDPCDDLLTTMLKREQLAYNRGFRHGKQSKSKPLRWQPGLPVDESDRLVEDVLISYNHKWIVGGWIEVGRKGDAVNTNDISEIRHVPLAKLQRVIE